MKEEQIKNSINNIQRKNLQPRYKGDKEKANKKDK